MVTEIKIFEKSNTMLIVQPHFYQVPLRLSELGLHAVLLMRMHAIISINESGGKLQLMFLKNRDLVCEESALFKELQEEFPSVYVVPDPERPYIGKYLAFEDDMDAIHFKLKYC